RGPVGRGAPRGRRRGLTPRAAPGPLAKLGLGVAGRPVPAGGLRYPFVLPGGLAALLSIGGRLAVLRRPILITGRLAARPVQVSGLAGAVIMLAGGRVAVRPLVASGVPLVIVGGVLDVPLTA